MLAFITINQLLKTWNELFFSNQSTLTICVLRLLTGILVLIETLTWQGRNKQLLLPDGWFGYEDYKANDKEPRFSLLNYLPPTHTSVNLVFGLQLVAGVCLMLGIFSNLAAVVCFVTLVSIHNRNIYVLSSGDTVYRFFCLFLIFAPSDTQLSLLKPAHLLRPEATGWPWILVMIQLFMANIYLKNVLFKLMGEWWRDGTATQKVLHARIWNRMELPLILDHTWFYKFTTYGTLVIETALFSLIWIEEFRLPVLATGVFLHLGLWIFLRFGFFQITMIFGLTAFIKPEEYYQFSAWIVHW
jgi:uncharacterized membrane protein YphA (DoxX/SURF4 family)